jgi:hypothetical protein
MTEPRLNVKRLFNVPPRPWPVVNRGNAINRVQKILKENHVIGIPSHWPKLYYGQTRANLNLNRTYRNRNIEKLPNGVYLYLIEYDPVANKYHNSFVRVHNLLESGSRHFQLPTRNKDRVIVAAGELSKSDEGIVFNLESGTYTKNLMTKTRNYMGERHYINLVKNALRNYFPNMKPVKNILIPKIPGTLTNLLARGNVSFYYGTPTNKAHARILANLEKAGLATNSAQNLIQKLINEGPGKNSGSPKARQARSVGKANENGRPAKTLRRSGRTAGRL